MAKAKVVNQSVKCPECASQKVWRDGLRYTRQGEVQRWLCRQCGYRFSKPQVKIHVSGKLFKMPKPGKDHVKTPVLNSDFLMKNSPDQTSLLFREDIGSHGSSANGSATESLNEFRFYNSNSRVSVTEEEGTKNMANGKTRQKWAAGATKPNKAEVKGLIFEFLWWMRKKGYAESTIVSRGSRLRRLVKLKADLANPESVKEVIATESKWSESRKVAMVYAYDLFAKWSGIEWERPIYRAPRKLPFIPLEREIDDLIAGCNRHISTFLEIGKETGARAGEIFSLKWIDIDSETKTISITPEKGSEPRIFKMSNKLIAMLNGLPRKEEQVFGHYQKLNYLRRTFERQRKRAAHKLGNPRFRRITFHTLRHWKATMEYHKTKDILYVMRILGHRNIKNTLIYTQLAKFREEDDYICKVARTPDEIQELIETGFEYICDLEDLKFFKKRK